ncbi:MAG: hypothetical protein QNJ11_13005 [Woeseiaceae bacterium]|nr:hypothetical protein [Woeseiaceae bacterium]
MASLTGIFKPEADVDQDTDKLVDLFRNRSELKKEFAALRNEKYQLQDRIKERQGAVERVQQKLNHLESLLLDPEWVYTVVVFYQLRRLAAHCEAKLERFAEQLKQQRENRVQSKVMFEWNEERKLESAAVQKRIGEHRMHLQTLEDRLQAERHKLSTMGGISKIFKGRSQAESVEDIEASIGAAQKKEGELLLELDAIEKREPPPHRGLDTGTKRSINYLILAFAQQLYLDYSESNLAGLAKEASDKSVGAVNYGTKHECDELLDKVVKRRQEIDSRDDSPDRLQHRARLIAEHALFRNDDDAVPAPGTVATVYDIDCNGVVRQVDANLLGENFFGVARILSR